MTVAINLSELPPPELIESLDFEVLLAAYKAKFIEDNPQFEETLALESEPVVKLLEFAAYRELQLRAKLNDKARSVLLAYSTGADLDHIAVTYYRGETRLVITEANPNAFPPVEAILESDNAFRERISLKLESYSTAGPTQAYIYHARSASAEVKDAECSSPTPGTSVVALLSTDGQGEASQALIETVFAALNTDEIRPLCEQVVVQSASIITYALEVGIYTYAGPDVAVVLAESEKRLNQYVQDHHRIGHDHTLSGLDAAATAPGVQRVVLNLNEDISVDKLHAAYCTGITVTHLGVDT